MNSIRLLTHSELDGWIRFWLMDWFGVQEPLLRLSGWVLVFICWICIAGMAFVIPITRKYIWGEAPAWKLKWRWIFVFFVLAIILSVLLMITI